MAPMQRRKESVCGLGKSPHGQDLATVQLAYLDPPFNIGLDYPGYDDRRRDDDYFAWLEDVFGAVLRVLSPSGSLWVQCGQTVQAEVCVMLKRLGMHWRNSIVWHVTF